MRDDPRALMQILCGEGDKGSLAAWDHNFSATRFRHLYGGAVATDPHLERGQFEWIRRVTRKGADTSLLCCPEDVQKKHPNANTTKLLFVSTAEFLCAIHATIYQWRKNQFQG